PRSVILAYGRTKNEEPRTKDQEGRYGESKSALGRPARPAIDVFTRVELARRARKRHPADGAGDRPLRPRPIVLAADRPRDVGVAVGVAPVEQIAIVQHDGEVERLVRPARPLEDLLRPVHAHVAVHPAAL